MSTFSALLGNASKRGKFEAKKTSAPEPGLWRKHGFRYISLEEALNDPDPLFPDTPDEERSLPRLPGVE